MTHTCDMDSKLKAANTNTTNATLNTTCERGSSGKFVPAGTRVTVLRWAKVKDDGHCLVRVGSYGKAFDTLQVNVTRDQETTK